VLFSLILNLKIIKKITALDTIFVFDFNAITEFDKDFISILKYSSKLIIIPFAF